MAKVSKKIVKAMAGRNYSEWMDVLSDNADIVYHLECLKDCKDLEERLDIILDAICERLTIEQIKVFAKPEFTVNQMESIYQAFIEDCNIEYVLFLANPKIDYEIMDALIYAIKHGLNKEDLEYLVSTKCKKNELKKLADSIANGMPKDKLDIISNPEFNLSQIREICRGFELGLTIEQVKEYADPNIPSYNMLSMREKMKHPKFIELIEPIKDKYTENQLYVFDYAFKGGLKEEDLILFSNPKFSA